jgi:hypothetical protein
MMLTIVITCTCRILIICRYGAILHSTERMKLKSKRTTRAIFNVLITASKGEISCSGV